MIFGEKKIQINDYWYSRHFQHTQPPSPYMIEICKQTVEKYMSCPCKYISDFPMALDLAFR
ncbi:hypothetical protein DERP_000318 [Dermatophagoides pteronyssinus]|uniref:Uncharacterized protein n=1 Tax=Dermatophagoides pteronyssinus TaxID=6956 RepID=A0ABQ8IZU3_DERPT|nr:hypothetical protein DERP_000318 [Dermatophagoides pteronyssinus]